MSRSRTNRESLVSGAAGLGAAVAAETGGELGERRRGPRARLLGAGLAALQARQGRDRERDLHHLPDPRCLRRRADRRSTSLGHGPNDIFTAYGASTDVTAAGRARGRTSTTPTNGRHDALRPRRRRDARPGRVPAPALRRAASRSRWRSSRRSGVMFIGVILGSIAGYFRGWIDTIISRVTEITMAFPVLLFVDRARRDGRPAARQRSPSASSATGSLTLVLIFSIFGWFYPAGSCAPRCCRSARRSTSRRRG